MTGYGLKSWPRQGASSLFVAEADDVESSFLLIFLKRGRETRPKLLLIVNKRRKTFWSTSLWP